MIPDFRKMNLLTSPLGDIILFRGSLIGADPDDEGRVLIDLDVLRLWVEQVIEMRKQLEKQKA